MNMKSLPSHEYVKTDQKANENVKDHPSNSECRALLHYYEDGGDEMYPRGYAYVSDSFKGKYNKE